MVLYCAFYSSGSGEPSANAPRQGNFRISSVGRNKLNPLRTKTPNIYSQEEINLYCIIKLATDISLQISKT